MIITLISFVLGILVGASLILAGLKCGLSIAKTVEDRERDFAFKVTNIEQGAIPIEQDSTYAVEQESTKENKGIEDVPPDNRSDIFKGTA